MVLQTSSSSLHQSDAHKPDFPVTGTIGKHSSRTPRQFRTLVILQECLLPAACCPLTGMHVLPASPAGPTAKTTALASGFYTVHDIYPDCANQHLCLHRHGQDSALSRHHGHHMSKNEPHPRAPLHSLTTRILKILIHLGCGADVFGAVAAFGLADPINTPGHVPIMVKSVRLNSPVCLAKTVI
jgi:hypothetical protein